MTGLAGRFFGVGRPTFGRGRSSGRSCLKGPGGLGGCWARVLLLGAAWVVWAVVCGAGFGAWGQSVQAITVPLARPAGVAFDASGNLYIAETNNHAIRKVDATGILTTVAGTGVQGFGGDGGPAVAALLDSPTDVAVDGGGNLYIADAHNQRIRRIAAATGGITTVAGTGVQGFAGDGGPATAAVLSLPTALAVDAAGDVFVSDTGNHRIREIVAATGTMVTVAGTGVQGFAGDGGAATAAAIDSPDGLAVDAAGRLYLADTHNQRIRAVDPATGIITTVAGSGAVGSGGDGAAAAAAALAMPRGLTVDAAGNLYFADMGNHRIRRVDAGTGVMTAAAGDGVQGFVGDGGAATAASLDSPRAATLAMGTRLVTLADTGNQRVRQVAGDQTIATAAGLGGGAPGTLTIAAPAVLGYGTGSVTATLASGTGTVVFLDVTGGNPVTVGRVTLSGSVAVLPAGSLAAGGHSLLATYTGDLTHGSAESTVLSLTIAPAPVVASATAVSEFYGVAIPALTGTLTGVLAQDAGKVAAVFSTAAELGSAVGSYPIAVTLTGAAAANYQVTSVSNLGEVTIAPAPSTAALAGTVSGLAVGAATTLTATVTSATSGVPGGSIVLLDGGVQMQAATLSAGGVGVFNVSFATPGTHSLTAGYVGSANFLPAISPATVETVGTAAGTDFSLAASGGSSQTVVAGTVASFGFTLVEQGSGLPSPVVLSAAGLPIGAVASFSPSYVPPGVTNTVVTLTIQTPNAGLVWPRPGLWPVVLAGLCLPWLVSARRQGLGRMLLAAVCMGMLCAGLSGCGNRVSAYGSSTAATTKNYPLTVTGTGTSASGVVLTHSAVVTLVVE
jgi:sugar lactone lactonase YvrE